MLTAFSLYYDTRRRKARVLSSGRFRNRGAKYGGKFSKTRDATEATQWNHVSSIIPLLDSPSLRKNAVGNDDFVRRNLLLCAATVSICDYLIR
jgi:hypothetical protein